MRLEARTRAKVETVMVVAAATAAAMVATMVTGPRSGGTSRGVRALFNTAATFVSVANYRTWNYNRIIVAAC